MTTETLPTRSTAFAATGVPQIPVRLDEAPTPSAGDVLEHTQVRRQYRDWRQTGTNLALAVAAPAAAGSVFLFAADRHLLVAKVLTVIAGLFAPTALALHRDFTASTRRLWVYATNSDTP
ncbi:hypothetical protein AB0I89_23955 [Micromonospora sp. NPDC049801]|uniref:hypothetical protein n=1 Tax=unclassified Micromonospora TaxID=2617518 RepID=UPI0033D120A3